MTRATGRDGLHDVLRRVGDLDRAPRSPSACSRASTPTRCSPSCSANGAPSACASAGRSAASPPTRPGLYRDALGAVPPGGLPEAFIADVPDALRELVARYARTHGPFSADELRARYGVDAGAVLRELERDGELVRGELRARAARRARLVRRGGPAPAAPRLAGRRCARRSSPPTSGAWRAFLPSWQGVDRHSRAGAGVDRLREVLVPLQGLALPVEIWERDVLPRRTGAYSPDVARRALRERRGRVGRRRSARALRARRALLPRGRPRDRPAVRRPLARGRRAAPSGPEHDAPARAPGRAAPASSPTCSPSSTLPPRRCARRSGTSCGPARRPTTPGRRCAPRAWRSLAPSGPPMDVPAAALGAPRGRPGRASPRAAGPAPSPRSRAAGRSPRSVFARRAEGAAGRSRAAARARRAAARALRDRHPRAGARRGDQGRLRDALRHVLQPRDARHLPPRLLHRGHGRRAVRAARRRRAAARAQRGRPAGPAAGTPARRSRRGRSVLAAADPAQPYGAALPWPRREGQERRPARVAGAYVVLVAEEPALYVERGGRGLVTLADHRSRSAVAGGPAGGREPDPLRRRSRRSPRPCAPGACPSSRSSASTASPRSPRRSPRARRALGFQSGPRRLTLSA